MSSDDDLKRVAEYAATMAFERASAAAVTMEDVKEQIDKSVTEAVKAAVRDSVKDAANVAVTETLISFGLDPKNRDQIHRNMIFLNDWRVMSGDMRKHVIFATLTVIIGAVLLAVWAGVRINVKMPV